jgi:RNA polymerase sigma-70 factor (ECF subfamily)
LEAEDVVQDVFVRVLEHRRSLTAVRDMRVWLVRVAWNLAIDRRRRIRPEQFDEGFAESLVARNLPADEALHEARRLKSVLRELERLPKAERNVLLLSVVEELGTAEMAEVLGRSESAVRALLFRARTRLRERLEEGEGRG